MSMLREHKVLQMTKLDAEEKKRSQGLDNKPRQEFSSSYLVASLCL